MADLRETSTIAGNPEEDARVQGSNYDYVFGTPANSDYAAGPELGMESDYAAGPGWGDQTWNRPQQTAQTTARAAMAAGYRNLQNYQAAGGGGGGGSTDWASGYRAAAQASSGTGGGGIRPTAGAGGGTGAYGGRTPYATIKESTTVLPKGMTWPTFTAPKWDEKKLSAKAQRISAPLITELGSKVQQAMARYYENPNVRRMVLRDTLSGYGIGLSRALAAGRAAATQEYGAEFSRDWTEAMTNYSIAKEKLLSQAVQVSSARAVYTPQELERITNNQLTGTSGSSYGGAGRTTKFNTRTGKGYNVAAS